MGKNIKSYATIPCPFPREREGSLTAKVLKILRLNMVRLNRTPYSHLKNLRLNRQNYTKFFNKIYGLTVKIIQNFSTFQNCPKSMSANYAKFAHFLFHIMFQAPAPAENPAKFQRITQIPRSSPTQSANYAKFAPFINIIHYVSDA